MTNPFGYAPATHQPQQFPPQPPHIAQAAPGKFDAVSALSAAWAEIKSNMIGWVGGSALILLLGFVPYWLSFVPVQLWFSAQEGTSNSEPPAFVLGGMVLGLILFLGAMILVQAIFYRNAAKAVRGETVSFADFFKIGGTGKVIGVSMLFGVLYVASMFTGIGAIVVALLFMFTVPAAAFPEVSIRQAFSSSASMFTQNFGQVIMLGLLNWVAVLAGMLMFGIGLLVAAPLMYLSFSYAYGMAQGFAKPAPSPF